MTDHPSTYKAEHTHSEGIDWDDRASLHRADDGQGIFDSAKGLRSGTLADMIRHVMMLPEDERADYVIQKAGDHKLGYGEIKALASHPDFPPPGEEGE